MKQKISIYDFDNTLIKGNSLHLFVKYIIKQQGGMQYLFNITCHNIRLWILTKILRRNKTEILIRYLKGMTAVEVQKYANVFIEKEISFNSTIIKNLEDDRKNGFAVAIVSGGIDEIVSAASMMLGINNWKASKLNYGNDGKCKGSFLIDLRGRKIHAIQEAIKKENIELAIITTDNKEDLETSKYFSVVRAVVLNSSGEKYWLGKADEIIKIDAGRILNFMHIFLPGWYFLSMRPNWPTLLMYRIGLPVGAALVTGNVETVQGVFYCWLLFITLYEIGYIDNDYYAVKRENSPSLRLSEYQKEKYVWAFIFQHIISAALIVLLLINNIGAEAAKIQIYGSILALLVFILHNRLERKNRIVTYAVLKASHLILPIMFIADIKWLIPLVCLLYIPQPLLRYANKVGYEITYAPILRYIVMAIQMLGAIAILYLIEDLRNLPQEFFLTLYLVIMLIVDELLIANRKILFNLFVNKNYNKL